MARKVETFASIENGVMKITHRDKFYEIVKQQPDSRGILTYVKKYKHRSTYTYDEETGKQGKGQNGYYHLIIVGLFVEGWYDMTGEIIIPEQAHEKLKEYCNGKDYVNEQTGKIVRLGSTTRDQTTVEAEEYYQRCRDWMYENFNIVCPLPNEQLEITI